MCREVLSCVSLSWIQDMNSFAFGGASDLSSIPVPINVPWLFTQIVITKARRLILNIPDLDAEVCGSRCQSEFSSWVKLKARDFLGMTQHFRIAILDLTGNTSVWNDKHFQRSICGASRQDVRMMWRKITILNSSSMRLNC